MKITKSYLKQLIKEELTSANATFTVAGKDYTTMINVNTPEENRTKSLSTLNGKVIRVIKMHMINQLLLDIGKEKILNDNEIKAYEQQITQPS